MKNYYPCQIQIILVNSPTRAYNFKAKRIPSSLNVFTPKSEGCYVYLPIPCNRSSLSRGHQTVTIINQGCYRFDGLWNVKAEYITLCLNAFAKLQNMRGASCPLVLMGNCPNCSYMPWPFQSTEWFAICLFQVVFRVRDSVATRKVPFETYYVRMKLKWKICR